MSCPSASPDLPVSAYDAPRTELLDWSAGGSETEYYPLFNPVAPVPEASFATAAEHSSAALLRDLPVFMAYQTGNLDGDRLHPLGLPVFASECYPGTL